MQAKILTVVLLLAMAVLPFAISMVKAQTTDESFSITTDQTSYNVGDQVTVLAQANYIDAQNTITITDVNVTDPVGNLAAQWNNLNIVLPDTTTIATVGTFTANIPGTYTVSADATGCEFHLWCCWYFTCHYCPKSLPDYPLGTIPALIAAFAVAALYVKVKRKRK